MKFLYFTGLFSIICFLAGAAGNLNETTADVTTASIRQNNNDSEEASSLEEDPSLDNAGDDELSEDASDEETETEEEQDIDSQPSDEMEDEEAQESSEEDNNQLDETPAYTTGAGTPMAAETQAPKSSDPVSSGQEIIEASFPENAPTNSLPSSEISSMIAEPDQEAFNGDFPVEAGGGLVTQPSLVTNEPANLSSRAPLAEATEIVQPQAAAPFKSEQATYDMASNGGYSYYAGVGFDFDAINPLGVLEIGQPTATDSRFQDKYNTFSSGLYFSPKIFAGFEQANFYKDWTLRLQAGVDFHTIELKKTTPSTDSVGNNGLASMKFRFHYTYNFAAQLKKKMGEKVDGYVGMSLLASWASISNDLNSNAPPVDVTGGDVHRFMFGISPQVGLIYHASDKMFYYLDGHLAFYQRLNNDGVLSSPVSMNARMQPIWAGIGLGIGWKL